MIPIVARASVIAPLFTSPHAQGLRRTARRRTASFRFFGGGEDILHSDIFRAVAEVYRVSSRPDDYLFLVARCLTADIPNNNGDCFPYEELTRFDASRNCLVYQTFQNAPLHLNHQAEDRTKALGFLLDVHLNADKKDDRYVEALVAADRKKNAQIVSELESGRRNEFSMGCGLFDTPIQTSEGVKALGDLRVGDLVLTHRGRYRRVTETMCRKFRSGEDGEFFRVRVPGRIHDFCMTGEHPFLSMLSKDAKPYRSLTRKEEREQADTVSIGDELDFIRLDELSKSDFVAIPVDRSIENSQYDTSEWAFLAGLYAGDGSMSYGKGRPGPTVRGNLAIVPEPYRVCFSFGERESAYAERVEICAKTIDPDAVVIHRARTNAKVSDVFVKSEVIQHGLLHLVGETSHGKELAPEVLTWSPRNQLCLVGGFIDADGHQSRARGHEGTVYFSSCNRVLIEQLQTLLLRNNILGTIQLRAGVPGSNRPNDHYQVNVGLRYLEDLISVCSWITTPNTNSYKLVRSHRHLWFRDYVLVHPRIEAEDYEGDVFNVEVEEDNSYVANGVAVHNCLASKVECSICAHVATTEDELCHHLRYHKGNKQYRAADTGWEPRHCFEKCGGVTYTELSVVDDAADQTAVTQAMLGKLAAMRSVPVQSFHQELSRSGRQERPLIERLGLSRDERAEVTAFLSANLGSFPDDHGMMALASLLYDSRSRSA